MTTHPKTARAQRVRRNGARRITRGSRSPRSAGQEVGAVRLPAQCTLADAETLKLRLMRLVKNVKPVTLDTRPVRRIDTASMQLLAAFARDRRSSGLKLRTLTESGAFQEAVELLGFAQLLECPDGASAQP